MIDTYINYFENLAVSHKDLQHQLGSDPEPGKVRFACCSTDDVITRQLRTKVGWPALVLEMYEWAYVGSNQYDAKTKYSGAFIILDHAENENIADERRAYRVTEQIMQDIIQKLWNDHYGDDKHACSTPFQYLNLDGDCVPVGPVFNNEFGFRFEFSFRPKLERKLTQAPADGTFL